MLVGSTTAAAGDPTIDFFNRGKEEAVITEVEIQDSVYSKWTLSAGIPNKSHAMSIKFDDFNLAAEVGIGGKGRMYGKELQLLANTITRITTNASVGGANRDYPNQELDAISYYVSWIIQAK